jgi:polysaccharide biosynthesis PFTS motif protein
MRGYKHLKHTNALELISDIKNELSNTPIASINSRYSKVIFGAGIEHAELIMRQYLISRVANYNLNQSLLSVLGDKKNSSLVYPLPIEWLWVIENKGIKVNKLRSAVLWKIYLLYRMAVSIYIMLIFFIRSCRETFRNNPNRGVFFSFFDDLSKYNLPQFAEDGCSYDIISWYMQWPGRTSHIDRVCHTVKNVKTSSINSIQVCSVRSAIMLLNTSRQLFLYSKWAVLAVITSIINLIQNKWWHAIILSEASNAYVIKIQSDNCIAADYLFNNSSWVYRPLWTYEAEKRGSQILFYFYSTNCENFKRDTGYSTKTNSWNITNWPYHLVWDSLQADFVHRTVGKDARIEIVGPIWFHNSSKMLDEVYNGQICVFDVQPYRDCQYQWLGMDFEYYVPETTNKFLFDIYEVIKEQKHFMLLKRKRNIGSLMHPEYKKALNVLENSSNFVSIDPDIPAIRIIKESKAVISMPFTSTALIAKELGKPSVYYDPNGIIQKDDRANHGVPVITGRDELDSWVQSVFNKDRSHSL